ncbi:MAG: hypothetical protein H7Y32_19440 [Chloroflexales bacterium]|nr:hypothetical protein [Chloroflexales bacterium]
MDLVGWYQQVTAMAAAERTKLKARARAAVVKNPRHAMAWATLVPFVDTDAHQIESIKRALKLEPHNRDIRALDKHLNRLATARLQALLQAQPTLLEATTIPRIGDILRSRGTPIHIVHEAIKVQRAAPINIRRPLLGEILVQQGLVMPHDLAGALLLQSHHILAAHQPSRVLPLGIQLVLHRTISLLQLHQALIVQIEGMSRHLVEPLGTILLRRGDITDGALKAALQEQRERFYERFF